VKSADLKFGNDHIFDVAKFDETSKWMEWSKNEFSHSLSLQATAAAPASCDWFMSSTTALDLAPMSNHFPVAFPKL
jgi:hypothetical protein